MDPTAHPDFEDVPAVNPVHLRAALIMIYEWSMDGEDIDDAPVGDETLTTEDFFSLLDRIVRTCEVDQDGAIALFKRAIALSAFCAEADLPGNLFEDSLPGRELCTAAAKAPVRNCTHGDDGEISHYFEEDAMLEALLAAKN